MSNNLFEAIDRLRTAQREYMKDRGNQELGKEVAVAARELDKTVNRVEEAVLEACGRIQFVLNTRRNMGIVNDHIFGYNEATLYESDLETLLDCLS